MKPSQSAPSFYRSLASRIVRVARAASIVPVAVACSTSAARSGAGTTSGGTGGAASSTTSATNASGTSSSASSSSSTSSSSSGAGGSIPCTGTADCPCWDCVCTAASNYEIARDCIAGSCATGVEACTALCAQLNSTLGTADAGPCFTIDAGQPPVTACLPVPDAGVCSTNFGIVLQQFLALNCPNGFEPYEILSGPISAPAGECCYTAHNLVCTAGGRPYVVDGHARAAPVRGGSGWRGEGSPALDGLTVDARVGLARAWTAEAIAEHASIASFARFALDLMAVGAPAHLVEAAHRAAIDEVHHARLCFALAGAYAGREVAPGALPTATPSLDARTLVSIAASAASEGCVDETIFAALASERGRRATDPGVRAVLERIAEDEARHAELAWRAVAWAIAEGGDEVRAAVELAIDQAIGRVIDRARGRVAASVASPASAELYERHGVFSAAEARRATELAITELVLPARHALRPVGVIEA